MCEARESRCATMKQKEYIVADTIIIFSLQRSLNFTLTRKEKQCYLI